MRLSVDIEFDRNNIRQPDSHLQIVRFEIEPDVENADAMGGHPIEIRSTPVAAMVRRCRGRDAAGGFGDRPTCDHRDGFRERRWIRGVKEHGVYTVIERLAQLIERVDFRVRS